MAAREGPDTTQGVCQGGRLCLERLGKRLRDGEEEMEMYSAGTLVSYKKLNLSRRGVLLEENGP